MGGGGNYFSFSSVVAPRNMCCCVGTFSYFLLLVFLPARPALDQCVLPVYISFLFILSYACSVLFGSFRCTTCINSTFSVDGLSLQAMYRIRTFYSRPFQRKRRMEGALIGEGYYACAHALYFSI
ncbi:hypothetical protein EDD21DRAFT_386938 [Dissophora ornata]|nr:hypothetical protein EDD21DRAFT_386938 [Dissophora ornata]